MRNLFSIVVLLTAVAFPATSHGGIIASFTADGSAFLPSFISVGQTVDVPLYLRQTVPNTELTSPGLLLAGLGVSFSPAGIVDVTSGSFGLGWNPLFSSVTFDNFAGTSAIQSGVDFGDPAVTETGGSILVGTLVFKGVSAGTALLTLGDADSGFEDTLDGNGNVLDGSIIFDSTTSITVTSSAVPEPSSLAALGVIGALAAVFGVRRARGSHVLAA